MFIVSWLTLQEDGDQSSRSVRARNDQPLRDSMARVGEEFPYHMAREPNQPLMHALCEADLTRIKSIFKPELLSYRATPNHLPITSLVVSLAQRTMIPKSEATPKYAAILEWLLEQGARVDARDIGGYTALGHAAGHGPVLPLAEVLLMKGSNANLQNRFGCTVLHSAVMAGEVCSYGYTIALHSLCLCCTPALHTALWKDLAKHASAHIAVVFMCFIQEMSLAKDTLMIDCLTPLHNDAAGSHFNSTGGADCS